VKTFPDEGLEALSKAELFELGAVDTEFFYRTFFPKTFRQGTPPFLKQVNDMLDGPGRLISLQLFRGASKTTRLRAFGAKRIAYGLARTNLWVGKSQDHAIASISWLKKQIEHNRLFTETFGLRKGAKWSEEHIEIIHELFEIPITVKAYGTSGSVRGVNIDDYRPDFIGLDDILDEENTATPEQREKVKNLVYGAFKESLAPSSEAPHAKMVMLQTPLNIEDLSMETLSSPEWISERFGCWSPETEDLPLAQRVSIWPERFPTEELIEEKQNALAGNRLSIFTREKECRIITAESSSFRAEWLRYYEFPPDDDMYAVLAIDPTPPPSEKELKQGLKNKDAECLAVVGKYGKDYYLLETSTNVGHDPSWTIAEFFRLALRYRVKRVIVESIAYQRTLAWLLKQAMDSQRIYFPISEYVDKRKKYSRILDALAGISQHGHLYVRRSQTDFIQQFSEYPNVKHDDVLDAVSIAVSELNIAFDEGSLDDLLESERKELSRLSYKRGAP
jgi:predicted phage terminase large subunit-like protein